MTLDTQLVYLLNAFVGLSPFVDACITFFAVYLAYVLIFLFFVFLFISAYTRREKWEIVIVVTLSSIIARFGVTESIHYFFHRPRPFVDLSVHQLHSVVGTSWSFPSGHATLFFGLSMALYLYDKRWGSLFLFATVLITLARVAAGVHYPSDIVGGACIGLVVASLIYATVQRFVPQEMH